MVHHEPRLKDMLEDPVVRLMMERDGVYRDDVLKLMGDMARKTLLSPKARPPAKMPTTAEMAPGHA